MPRGNEELKGFQIREVDLTSAMVRIQPHDKGTWLPGVGLPDYGDPRTYNFVVGLAREVRGDDPGYAKWLNIIPLTYDGFKGTLVDRHWHGLVRREDVNADQTETGRPLIEALGRATLDLVGIYPPDKRLFAAEDEQTGRTVALLRTDILGTLAQAQGTTDNIFEMQRLNEVLQDPNDRYWQILRERGIINPSQDLLDEVRRKVMSTQIVKIGVRETNVNYRDRGVAEGLSRLALRDAISPGATNMATGLLRNRALPDHKTALAPALTLGRKVSEVDRALFLAAQIIQIATYQRRYRDAEERKSTDAERFSQFADLKNVAQGVMSFGEVMIPYDLSEQNAALSEGLRRRLISEPEAVLLRFPGVEKMQYTVVSIPTTLLTTKRSIYRQE